MDNIEKLNVFLRENPDDSFIQHALALEYIKINNDEKAEILFKNILLKDPEYIGSYYHLGKLLERAGKNNEAVDIYEKGIILAKQIKNFRAQNELQSALDELLY